MSNNPKKIEKIKDLCRKIMHFLNLWSILRKSTCSYMGKVSQKDWDNIGDQSLQCTHGLWTTPICIFKILTQGIFKKYVHKYLAYNMIGDSHYVQPLCKHKITRFLHILLHLTTFIKIWWFSFRLTLATPNTNGLARLLCCDASEIKTNL